MSISLLCLLHMCLRLFLFYVQCDSDRTILSGWRRVAFVEEFFDILSKVHYLDTGHIGTKKTVTEVMHVVVVPA